jgi:hypothetical protein
MKYAVEMGSGAMIYVLSFVKIGSGVQKLMGVRDSQTDKMDITYAYFQFCQNMENTLKTA